MLPYRKSEKEVINRKGVQKEKIKVIYNGITLEQNDEVDPVVAAEVVRVYKKEDIELLAVLELSAKGKTSNFCLMR